MTKKNPLALRPRNLDSSYLCNGRLNPVVIRCNIEPAAGHLGIWYLLKCESLMTSQSDEISEEENGNNSDIDPIEMAKDRWEQATFLNFGGNFLIFEQL